MKQTKHVLILIFLVLIVKTSFAQQDAQFSQYMFNSLYYNPGFAGVEGVTRFTGIHRTQWLNYQPTLYDGVAPQSTIISASTPFPKQKMGVGGFLMVDRLGPLTTLNFDISISKHVKIGTGTLGLGLSGGVLNQRINANDYIVVEQEDPVYQHLRQNGNISQVRPDLAVGAWYHHKKYYFGASFNHLVRSRFSFGLDQIRSQLNNHLYITGGYNFQVLPNLVVTPSAFVQSDLNTLTYLFGAIATLDERLYAGINVRQSFAERVAGTNEGRRLSNDDIIFLVGVNVLKNAQGVDALRIGYAFDFVTSGVDAKKRTSHEIMLSYLIPNPFGVAAPPVRTPRYRHDN
ncbi:MAG: type IX secretion system membrane protein PorP/SprF [Cytophagaceae bacterium]